MMGLGFVVGSIILFVKLAPRDMSRAGIFLAIGLSLQFEDFYQAFSVLLFIPIFLSLTFILQKSRKEKSC